MDFKAWNKQIIEEFRANNGEVAEFAGRPLILLHTVGAKSGEPRTNPLMYDSDGDRLYVFASMGGAPRNPDWYYNVKARPEVTVERGDGSTATMRASELPREERDRRFARMKERYPQFAEYEASTDRVIPVIELQPA